MEKSEIFVYCIEVLIEKSDLYGRYTSKMDKYIDINEELITKYGYDYAVKFAAKEWLKNNMIFK